MNLTKCIALLLSCIILCCIGLGCDVSRVELSCVVLCYVVSYCCGVILLRCCAVWCGVV